MVTIFTIAFVLNVFLMNLLLYLVSKKIQSIHEELSNIKSTQLADFLKTSKIYDYLNKVEEKITQKEKGTTNNWENIKEAFRNKKKSDIID